MNLRDTGERAPELYANLSTASQRAPSLRATPGGGREAAAPPFRQARPSRCPAAAPAHSSIGAAASRSASGRDGDASGVSSLVASGGSTPWPSRPEQREHFVRFTVRRENLSPSWHASVRCGRVLAQAARQDTPRHAAPTIGFTGRAYSQRKGGRAVNFTGPVVEIALVVRRALHRPPLLTPPTDVPSKLVRHRGVGESRSRRQEAGEPQRSNDEWASTTPPLQ
jgi:hypothetical protein